MLQMSSLIRYKHSGKKAEVRSNISLKIRFLLSAWNKFMLNAVDTEFIHNAGKNSIFLGPDSLTD
jgi:hypothetical protein